MVQVTPDKPGEALDITDPTTLRCESELLTLTAAVNEIDAFIASERQTYLTRLKPELEADTTEDKDVWEISEESSIHMQCLEHNLQVAIDRLQEIKNSAAALRAGIELSRDRALVLVGGLTGAVGIDKECAPIIN
jgi:hypothetical protein